MLQKMKCLLPILVLFLAFPLQAQERRGEESSSEEMMEKKLDFFAKNLKLTKDEQRHFNDAYNTYLKKKRELRKRYKKEIIDRIKKEDLKKLSKEEKEKMIDAKIALDRNRCRANEKFIAKLREILPPEKLIKFFKLERDYNRKMKGHSKEKRKEEYRGPKDKEKSRHQININKRRK